MLRQKAEFHKGVAAGVGLLLIAVGATLILLHLFGRHRSPPALAKFTNDDGATLFKESVSRIPPFDYQGHEAVSAYPYTADGGKHQWMQCLAKYDPNAANSPEELPMPITNPRPTVLVKKPGAREWVYFTDPAAVEIVTPKAPGGMGTEKPEEVLP